MHPRVVHRVRGRARLAARRVLVGSGDEHRGRDRRRRLQRRRPSTRPRSPRRWQRPSTALGGEDRAGPARDGRGGRRDPRRRGAPARAGRHRHRQVAGLPRARRCCTPRTPTGGVVVATATLALQHQLVSRDLPRLADALEPVLGRRPTYAVLKGRHNYVCLDRLHRGADDREDSDDRRAVRRAHHRARQAGHGRCASGSTSPRPATATTCRSPVDGRVWRGVSVSGRECVGAAEVRLRRGVLRRGRAREGGRVAGGHHQPRDARDPHARQRARAARARRRGDRRGARARRPRDRGGDQRDLEAHGGPRGAARAAARRRRPRRAARVRRRGARHRARRARRGAVRAGARREGRGRRCCSRSPRCATPRTPRSPKLDAASSRRTTPRRSPRGPRARGCSGDPRRRRRAARARRDRRRVARPGRPAYADACGSRRSTVAGLLRT